MREMRVNVVMYPRPDKQTIIPLEAPSHLQDDLDALRHWAMAEAARLSSDVQRLELYDDGAAAPRELWLRKEGAWFPERRARPRF